MADKTELGRLRYGEPAFEILSAIVATLDEEPWTALRRDVMDYYLGRVPMQWLPEMTSAALSAKQLDGLAPADVKSAIFLLTRDMLRHNREELTPPDVGWQDDWVEVLGRAIAERAGLPEEVVAADPEAFEFDDPFERESISWAVRIAKPFGIAPEKLALVHGTIVEGVLDDVVYGDGGDESEDEDEEIDDES